MKLLFLIIIATIPVILLGVAKEICEELDAADKRNAAGADATATNGVTNYLYGQLYYTAERGKSQ